jgi:hypothetical protein
MKRTDGPPETFNVLDFFMHTSGKTRRGGFTIHRNTSRKKFQANRPQGETITETPRRPGASRREAAQCVPWLVPVTRVG